MIFSCIKTESAELSEQLEKLDLYRSIFIACVQNDKFKHNHCMYCRTYQI